VSFYIDQFFGYVITVSRYLLHRIKFCKISGIVKLLKVIRLLKLIKMTIKSSSKSTHAGSRTTLPLINNYTIEDSIIYYLILL
jgi:hypothetical protein